MPDAPPPKFTLLLLATEDQLPGATGVDRMTWAEAEIGGYESFGRFDRIVVTPPQFPDRQGEHRRAQMIRALIRRLAGGAHAVFLLPPVVEGGVGSPSLFHRAEDLLREVTGARLEDRLDPNAVPLVFDPAAPRRLRRYLARHSPDVVVRVPADPLGFGPLVAHTVLAGFAHLDEDPCAVVGFPGNGAWLVLPWRPNGGEDDALVDVLALLDDAGDLRSAHDRAQATPLRGANGGRAQRLLDRPTPGSKIGKLLARFERAEGKFIVISREEDNNVLRLRRRYGIPIESALELRQSGEALPPDAKGYRLRPPT